MMQYDTGLIPLGYYIVRNSGMVSKPSWASSGYVTVAGCLCEGVIPGIESVSLEWERLEKIKQEWNLSATEARRLYDAVRNSCMQINYEQFHNFLNYDTPARICREFFARREDVLIIGLCSDDKHFLEEPEIKKVAPLPKNAELMGWDLYEFGDYGKEEEPLPPLVYHFTGMTLGLGCSFCCCDMDGALIKRMGVQLNSYGMYPDAKSAKQAAEIVNSERLGEPCHYLPFALFRCFEKNKG